MSNSDLELCIDENTSITRHAHGGYTLSIKGSFGKLTVEVPYGATVQEIQAFCKKLSEPLDTSRWDSLDLP